MKKIALLLMSIFLIGCSSKTINYDSFGQKSIQTKTDASSFSDAQAAAYIEYYRALSNPPVIATIPQTDGSIIKIHNQVPPPLPIIRQHENQWVEPVTGLFKTGIQVVGGGWAAKEIVGALEGTTINSSGSGNISIDRSDNLDIVEASGGGIVKESSDNDNSIVENADPTIVEKQTVQVVEQDKIQVVQQDKIEVVQQEVVYEVRPEIVNPEVIIVDPVIVQPAKSEVTEPDPEPTPVD